MMRASQRLSMASAAAASCRERTALPIEPLVMTFKDVQYSVPVPPVRLDSRRWPSCLLPEGRALKCAVLVLPLDAPASPLLPGN